MPILITKLPEDELKSNLPSNTTSKTNDVPSKSNNKDDICTVLENAKMVVNGLEDKCQDTSIDEKKKTIDVKTL